MQFTAQKKKTGTKFYTEGGSCRPRQRAVPQALSDFVVYQAAGLCLKHMRMCGHMHMQLLGAVRSAIMT